MSAGPDGVWTSGIFKEPVAGAVWLRTTNLDGDGQADLTNHGGPDKAVLVYSADHYPRWTAELSRDDLPHGAFGENFTVAGLDELTVCIGDTFQIGAAHVQVSQPRQPCWKLERRLRHPGMIGLVQATSRSGWYVRVLREAQVAPDTPVTLLHRPHPEWTIARASQAMRYRLEQPAEAAALGCCPELATSWRSRLPVA
ncbi:MAG: MOSC domain-containing protein [Chloroflexota bacterium]